MPESRQPSENASTSSDPDRHAASGIDELDKRIVLQRAALNLHPPGHPDRHLSLDDLANSLWDRFEQNGRMSDLEEAIKHDRAALNLRPPGHPDRHHSLCNLAISLSTRFKQSGCVDDLEEAIKHDRAALDLYPPGHPDRHHTLGNLALSLLTRFYESGRMDDLEEAIEYQRATLNLRPPGHPERHLSLGSLANSLWTRFDQSGRVVDLEEAIEHHRAALNLCPPGYPDRHHLLGNLASSLWTRFNQLQSGHMDDLEETIEHQRAALNLRPPGHPDRRHSLGALANSLRNHFEALKYQHDIQEALKYSLESYAMDKKEDHPNFSMSCMNLAEIHYLDNNVHLVFSLLEEATGHIPSPLARRFEASILWTDFARIANDRSASSAYGKALLLAERCLFLCATVESHRHFLSQSNVRLLGSDATSWAIHSKHFNEAIHFFERGRALFWSKIRGFRQYLADLRAQYPLVAEEFEALSTRLEELATFHSHATGRVEEGSASDHPQHSALFDSQIKEQRLLTEKWDAMLSKIQAFPGFSDFLSPMLVHELKTAAAHGPAILINHTPSTVDALIILPTGNVSHVPLTPSLSEYTSEALLSELFSRMADVRQRDVNRHLKKGKGKHSTKAPVDDPCLKLLRSLWSNIFEPVVRHLRDAGFKEGSRIWWCPGGELSQLPIHAAGPYRSGEQNLHDHFISSYTPTLSSLIVARRAQDSVAKSVNVLAAGISVELPQVEQELETLQHLFGEKATILKNSDAVLQSLLSALPAHPIVHFSCHGARANPREPFSAYFKLHDGALSLHDIMQKRLPHAELDFLAACHSAVGESQTPDEAFSLAATLQFCGFRRVIGTLWAMYDDDGPPLVEAFYEHILREGVEDAAVALHLAVKSLLIQNPELSPSHWATFIHIGI